MGREKKTAFTLIELLIVVAIIAILAAIAVPNFLEAQIRAKVSRVKGDMRTVALAMEAYFVDWNAYVRHYDFSVNSAGVPTPPYYQQYWWWSPLTTPVAYMTLDPIDVFQQQRWLHYNQAHWFGGRIHYDPIFNTWDSWMGTGWGPYEAFTDEMRARGVWYTLQSIGPDGKTNVSGRLGDSTVRVAGRTRGDGLAAFYDPTNGTVSYGDIVYFGPGVAFDLRW